MCDWKERFEVCKRENINDYGMGQNSMGQNVAAAVPHDGVLRPTVNAEAREASRQLARLAERQLNYAHGRIDPNALRLFIEAHWDHIIKLAHTIHESRERP